MNIVLQKYLDVIHIFATMEHVYDVTFLCKEYLWLPNVLALF